MPVNLYDKLNVILGADVIIMDDEFIDLMMGFEEGEIDENVELPISVDSLDASEFCCEYGPLS